MEPPKRNDITKELDKAIKTVTKAGKDGAYKAKVAQHENLVKAAQEAKKDSAETVTREACHPVKALLADVTAADTTSWKEGLDEKKASVNQMYRAADKSIVSEEHAKHFSKGLKDLEKAVDALTARTEEWDTEDVAGDAIKAAEKAMLKVQGATANATIIENLHMKSSKTELKKIKKNITDQRFDTSEIVEKAPVL